MFHKVNSKKGALGANVRRLWELLSGKVPRRGAFLLLVILVVLGWANAFRTYKAEALTKAADTLVDMEQFHRAEALAKQATELNPRSGYAWFQYATSMYLQQNFQQAIQAFERAIPVLPHYYNAVRLLAIAQYKLHDYETAAKWLSEYLTMNPRPAVTPEEIFRIAGLSWLRLGDLSASNHFLTWASFFATDKGEILKVQAMVTILMNQPGTADYYFRSFRFHKPDLEFNPYELVANAMAANKVKGAIDFMTGIHESNPGDLSVVKALAIAHSRAGTYGKAEQLLSGAAAANPDNAELYLIYGDVLYAQRKYEQAFQQYDRHLQLAPESQFRQDILKKKATSRF